jgi:hypothetical protein
MPLALRPLRHPPRRSICPLPALSRPAVARGDPGGMSLGQAPALVRDRLDAADEAAIPDYDGRASAPPASPPWPMRATPKPKIPGARLVRPARLARASDVVAFLAAEHGHGRSVDTVELRRAPFATCISSPAARSRSRKPWPARAAPPPMPASCPARNLPPPRIFCARSWRGTKRNSAGLRDRALLLVGFAGALRCAELRPLYR